LVVAISTSKLKLHKITTYYIYYFVLHAQL
jgi:hypothetical protein